MCGRHGLRHPDVEIERRPHERFGSRDECSDAVDPPDHTVGLETAQHLAHRRTADTEVFCKIRLGWEPLATLQTTVADREKEPTPDVVEERLATGRTR